MQRHRRGTVCVMLQRVEFIKSLVKLLPEVHQLPGYPEHALPKQFLLALMMYMSKAEEEQRSTEVSHHTVLQ